MKVAIIGSNRGLGLELTKKLIADGHEIFAFCRTTSESLEKLKTSKVITDFDVTSFENMKSKVKSLNESNFDLLIHVSGILKSDSIDSFSVEDVMKQFEVNTLGAILTAKAFKPLLKKGSKIVLLTSRMGSIEDNTSGGMYGYRMSKTALNMAGKGLATDYKEDGITVLLLHPGFVKTDMTGNQGHITAEDSAAQLVEVMMQKTEKDSGTFWHAEGQALPW